MDKKLKRIIFIIMILIVILISLIILLVIINSKNMSGNTEKITEENENVIENYGREDAGIDLRSYFDIKACMEIYLNCLNINSLSYYGYDDEGNYKIVASQEEINKAIYDVLSKKYISSNNITVQNVLNYAPYVKEENIFVPLEIKLVNESGSVKSFLVHALQERIQDFSVINEMYAVINIDITKMAFSIEPLKGNYNSISDVKIDTFEQEVDANGNNTFRYNSYTNETICKDYIDLYKHIALGSPERMYNILDKNYREAKFGSLESFKKYVTENKEKIYGIRATQYKAERGDEYTKYVCIDQNGHYYIIKENKVLDYSMVLDTYTVDLPEFLKKYENATDTDKVLMNIQKFFSAIDDGDYKYAYSKLDTTFRNSNFKTQAEFERYAKDTFFTNNKLASGKAEKQGELYLYKITISDDNEKDSKVISKNFVMQLKEGTDFVMSFEVN